MTRGPEGPTGGRRATIVLLPGDGIGPEVVTAARRVLEAVARAAGHAFELEEALIGGAAIEAAGDPLPDETLARCRAADAILLGAVGGPEWDRPEASVRPEQGLLRLRRELELFANVRPVVPYPELAVFSPLKPALLARVDLVVVRELTGGIYFGARSRERLADGSERASDTCTYTTAEIERVVRVAAALARSRSGRLTSVDKANVLETSRLWRRVAARVVAAEYPDITLEHALVDSCAMQLVMHPSRFDVIVTENMFGDILTDEAAVLAGSIGLLPSASLGGTTGAGAGRPGVYEPVHGSAPDIAGTGAANPIGAMLSVALMLRHSLELDAEARTVEAAVRAAIARGVLTPDLSSGDRGATTEQVTDAVVAAIADLAGDRKARAWAGVGTSALRARTSR